MKILIICIGKLREPAWASLCDGYLTRLQRYGPIEVLEVKEGRGKEPGVAVAEESTRILDALGQEKEVWVLDERGSGLSSPELAHRLQMMENQGRRRLAIVLGGAYGLDERVRTRGKRISLSQMTFPHELCRAILLEQLYRARTIQRGEPYHHG